MPRKLGYRRCLSFESLEGRRMLSAGNISLVPFWDGETVDPSGPLLNRLGGNPLGGAKTARIEFETETVRAGTGGFRIDTNGTIAAFDFDAVGLALTGFYGEDPHAYVDARDLTGFESVEFWLRNETETAFTLQFEIKDYRDSNLQRAQYEVSIPEDAAWLPVTIPLDLTSGWDIDGEPDLSRARLFSFVLEAQAAPVTGSLYVDEMVLRERGGDLPPETADFDTIVDRLALRQFRGIWGARDRATGLVPSVSSYANVMGLNTTAGLVQMLPTAVEQDWLSPSEADDYVALLVATLNTVWDRVAASGNGGYLPPRYMDRDLLVPTSTPEESSVDAAFLFLALYRYKSLPGTPGALVSDIDSLLGRFDFAPFSVPAGWRMAYRYDLGDFASQTYDGYSGEVYVISLAAHLAPHQAVSIATHWNSATLRSAAYLVDPAEAHLVHAMPEYRAPFLQWLFPLLVDVRDRGADTYPEPELAGNVFWNAVLYEREVFRKLEQLQRPLLVQPDAGDDGSGARYEQFSLYNDYGDPDLYMPWSVALGLGADPERVEFALRDILVRDFQGPLGLTDAVRIATGAEQPSMVTARHDFWNVTLSTWALMQYRYGETESLAELPEVASALDQVLPRVLPAGAAIQALMSSHNWIAFAPRNYNPQTGQDPSLEQLRADLQLLYDDGWRGLVTYTLDGTLQHIPRLAKEIGFTSVIAGLFWFDEAQLAREKAAVAQVDSFVDAYVIGNEGLLGGRYTRDDLAIEIEALRKQTGKPVATSETGLQYLSDPTLLDLGDWVFPTIQPYCADPPIRDVSEAVQHVAGELVAIQQAARQRQPGRLVVLKESWWPTAGDAAATESAQADYFRQLAGHEIPFVWGEAFDQPWKTEPTCGGQGPHWGLYTTEGRFKATVPQLHGVIVSAYSDSDHDGASDLLEQAAPFDGDGNQDGIPDAQQPHVASLPGGYDGRYVTLIGPAQAPFQQVATTSPAMLADGPAGMQFDAGLLSFQLSGLAPGDNATVRVLDSRASSFNTFYQYGATPVRPATHWYRFLSPSGPGAQMLVGLADVHLKDGARGDHDLVADGTIHFQGGPAFDQRPFPWANPESSLDVNEDRTVSPRDALLIINQLVRAGVRDLPVPPSPPDVAYLFLDVFRDNKVAPRDALLIINDLARNGVHPVGGGAGEGEPVAEGEQVAAFLPLPHHSHWLRRAVSVAALPTGAVMQREAVQAATPFLLADDLVWLAADARRHFRDHHPPRRRPPQRDVPDSLLDALATDVAGHRGEDQDRL